MIKVSFVIWRPFQKLNTEFSELGGGFLDVVLTKKSNQVPYFLVLLFISVLTFQLVLVFIFGVIIKFNGYPLWIPLVEGIFRVSVLPPV